MRRQRQIWSVDNHPVLYFTVFSPEAFIDVQAFTFSGAGLRAQRYRQDTVWRAVILLYQSSGPKASDSSPTFRIFQDSPGEKMTHKTLSIWQQLFSHLGRLANFAAVECLRGNEAWTG
jgi:hypothetical protein